MKYLGESDLELFLNFLETKSILMEPCSEHELEQLKSLVNGSKLPQTYLSFMKRAGNRISFFDGSDYTMRDIAILKDGANELLEENDLNERLASNQFVFFMHQGYQFCFFNLDEGDNPPVYYYGEGEELESFIKKNDTFVEYLIDYYNEVESFIKD